MELHPDFRDLLAEFVRAGVRFVVLGGYAVSHHAKPRATKDLDLLVSGSEENLALVAEALGRFGAPTSLVDAARAMEPNDVLYMGVPPVRIDILRHADGIDTEHAIVGAETVQLDELTIPVIGLDDLIANKRASGRPQDLADVALLERVQARKTR